MNTISKGKNSTSGELKLTNVLFGPDNLLTLEDVIDIVEASIVSESLLCTKEVLLQKQVIKFSDPDRDYLAVVIVLNNKVMIRTCDLAFSALANHKKITYHIELWNKSEGEFHHLSKNVNLKKITELAISVC